VNVTVDADGRRRLWYGSAEIEQMCESRLEGAGLLPADGSCEIDIEALVETELGAVVDYSANLAPSVLGYTLFERPPRVVINGTLTDGATRPGAPAGLYGRWRATLAHEAAHLLLHARLYSPEADASGRPSGQPIRCLRTTIEDRPARPDWREVQANMGMAALLMPKSLFDREASVLLREAGVRIPPVPASDPAIVGIVPTLAQRFRVSKQAAGIRLETCGYAARP
jgi:hypothetical protein